jgi:hypothetical protein
MMISLLMMNVKNSMIFLEEEAVGCLLCKYTINDLEAEQI